MYILEETIILYKRFTLLESLMPIILIVGIVTTIALPGPTQTIRSSLLTTRINEAVVFLNFARGLIIKKGQLVSIRKSDAQYDFPLPETGVTPCTTSPFT